MKSDKMLHEETQVTFRFVGDDVNPQLITSKIGVQPSATHTKGNVVEKHPDRTYPTGYWGIESSMPPNCSLKKHLKHLLDLLEPQVSAIKECTKSGVSPNFFCGIFTAGADFETLVELDADAVKRIADIGASLKIHVYCCDEED